MGEALGTCWVEKSSTGRGLHSYSCTICIVSLCTGPRGRIAATDGGLGPGAGVLLYILRD